MVYYPISSVLRGITTFCILKKKKKYCKLNQDSPSTSQCIQISEIWKMSVLGLIKHNNGLLCHINRVVSLV